MVKKVNVLSAILRNIPMCYVVTPFCAGLTTGGHKVECFISHFWEISQNVMFSHLLCRVNYRWSKVECFISHFEKYPKMLCFHTFLCRVNYRWSKGECFISHFLRTIPKCYVFTPFCHYTHVNWLKPLSFSYS